MALEMIRVAASLRSLLSVFDQTSFARRDLAVPLPRPLRFNYIILS